jgi:ATP adenylyltransferase/5',5'''-P-1,P-4-tetraphosphate phosphorylase II
LTTFIFLFFFFFFKGFFLSVDASYEQMTKTARVNDEHMRTECELSMKRRALRVLYLWVNLEMYFGAYAFPFSVSG